MQVRIVVLNKTLLEIIISNAVIIIIVQSLMFCVINGIIG